MPLDFKKYASNLWTGISDTGIRRAIQEVAEKMQVLAADMRKETSSIEAFPVGGIIFTLDAACPAGFTEVSTYQGRMIRALPTSGNSGATGGSSTHSHTMTHTHSGVSDTMPSHSHTINSQAATNLFINAGSLGTNFASGGTFQAANASSFVTTASHNHGGSSASAGAHIHGLAIDNFTGSTGSASFLPLYVDLRMCQKT